MKAIVYDRYGPPEVLRLEDVAAPRPGDGDVVVRVRAAPATRADSQMRSAQPAVSRIALGLLRPRRRPSIPGAELAGEVTEVGRGVSRFRVGDRVWASTGAGLGAVAEYAVVPECGAVSRMPDGVGFDQAAAICEGALTALTFLRDEARLERGQRLLVVGASGAVGTAAVQLGRHLGARVTGVCSGGNEELVRSLGAHEVIDYTRQDYTMSGLAWDVVLDTTGSRYFRRARRVLAPRGIYLSTVLSATIVWQTLWTRRSRGQRSKIAFAGLRAPEQRGRDLTLARDLTQRGELRAPARSGPLRCHGDPDRRVGRAATS